MKRIYIVERIREETHYGYTSRDKTLVGVAASKSIARRVRNDDIKSINQMYKGFEKEGITGKIPPMTKKAYSIYERTLIEK